MIGQMQQNSPKPWCFHHVSQLGWDWYPGMQCFPFSKQNSFYLKQKLYFRLILTLNIVQTVLWFVSVIFNKMQMGRSVLFGEQGPLFAALPYTLFVVQFSPDGGLVKMNIIQSALPWVPITYLFLDWLLLANQLCETWWYFLLTGRRYLTSQSHGSSSVYLDM